MYRINWLRARAKKMRWEEEATLILKEMEWTVAFFENTAEKWKSFAVSTGGGASCYAFRKSDMFSGIAAKARKLFVTITANQTGTVLL